MKNEIYKTKSGELLYRIGYRIDSKYHWRRPIDSSFGLSESEQRINSLGGVALGKETRKILDSTIREVGAIIKDYTEDEIQNSRELKFLSSWLIDAKS